MLSQDEIMALLSGEEPLPSPEEEDKYTPHLYHWRIEKSVHPYTGKEYVLAHGVVTGHRRLTDTTFIHTSPVQHIEVDRETEQVCIRTKNTEYHCRLSECDFSKPGTCEFIPGLSEYAEKYEREKEYDQDDNTILLILSDHESYYFKTALIKRSGVIHRGWMRPHIGTFQDSCLISCKGYEQRIDIRYFPHYRHLETYCWETDNLPVYLENEGDSAIFYRTYEGLIELKPGERKLVSKENAMSDEDAPILDQGDLYPAEMLF